MGQTVSTRNLTLVDDGKSGVIKISESLAHRLTTQIKDVKSTNERTTQTSADAKPTQPPPSSPAPPQPAPQVPVLPPLKPQTVIREDFRPTEAVTALYAEEARRAMLRLQDEQDQALAEMQQTWMTKMDEREKQFAEASQLTATELEKTAAEVDASFASYEVTPVCRDSEAAVLECYKKYPGQPLRCAESVQQFTRCVNSTILRNINDTARKTG